MTGRYKAVVFDLDGTLVDSLEDIADAVNGMLSTSGYPQHSYLQFRFLVGNGMRSLITKCLPETQRDEQNVSCCLAMVTERYRAGCLRKTRLYDGVPELLDALVEAGLRMAVLSNKPDELTQNICSALLHRWPFGPVLGATDRFARKPDPASALHIASTMGFPSEQIVFVGDSDVDMKTARSAGMFAAGACWGFRPRAELEENGAERLLTRPEELLAILR